MKQYPKYKDSGVQWIGLIPEHWNVTKTKYIARLYTGNSLDDSQKEKYLTDPLEINESAIPYIATKDISSDCNCVTYYNGLAIPKEEDGFKKAPKGSFLLCVEGGSAGRKHAYLEHEVCFVNKLCCFDSSLNSRYHYYFIQTEPFRNHFKQMIQGLIGGVSVSDLNNMEVVVPSDSEQQAIAQFLDSKTAKIDESVLLYEQQKTDLVEYRKALISDTVTRGLNPNAKLKDSGIQWLGQIPEGWNVSKIKYCCDVFGRIGFRGYTTEDMVPAGEGAITLSPSNIKDGKMSFDKLAYLSWAKYEESPEIQIQVGDILLTKTGSSYGKCAYVDYLPLEATINPQFVVLKNFHENARYLAYIMQTPMIKKQEEDSVVGGAIPTMAQEDINNFVLPLPSLAEQQQIVAFLDSKTAMIDEAIRRIDEQITDLRNYRTALITDAVTGKIDVR